jgi:hypothetical protein
MGGLGGPARELAWKAYLPAKLSRTERPHENDKSDEAPDWGSRRLATLFAPQLATRAAGCSVSVGELTLSLVPVLALRSACSPGHAARCSRYAQAQIELIDKRIELAMTLPAI